jgi:hypothetical protein
MLMPNMNTKVIQSRWLPSQQIQYVVALGVSPTLCEALRPGENTSIENVLYIWPSEIQGCFVVVAEFQINC